MVDIICQNPAEIWQWRAAGAGLYLNTHGRGFTSPTIALTAIVAWGYSESSRRRLDEGYILTTASQTLMGENDCFHYNVDGSLTLVGRDWCQHRVTGETESRSYQVTVEGKSSTYYCTCFLSQYDSCVYPHTLRHSWSYYNSYYDNGTYYSYYKNITFSIEVGKTPDTSVLIIGYDIETVFRHGGPDHKVYPTEHFVQRMAMISSGQNYWNLITRYAGPIVNARGIFGGFALPYARENSLYKHLCERADDICSFGDLSADAADSIRMLDINTAQYAKDLIAIKELATGLTSLASPEKGVKSISKKAAKTFLAAHYGLRLTVADTQKVAEAIGRIDTAHTVQRTGASRHLVIDLPGRPEVPVSVSLRLSAVVDSLSNEDLSVVDSFKRVDRKLYELDLMPTASNIWDAIPFSFVVDWFAPIGSSLEAKEKQGYVSSLNVRKAFYSRKFEWALRYKSLDDSYILSGSLVFKIYERYCQNSLVIPPMRVDNPKGLSGHWVEGAAILISNI